MKIYHYNKKILWYILFVFKLVFYSKLKIVFHIILKKSFIYNVSLYIDDDDGDDNGY